MGAAAFVLMLALRLAGDAGAAQAAELGVLAPREGARTVVRASPAQAVKAGRDGGVSVLERRRKEDEAAAFQAIAAVNAGTAGGMGGGGKGLLGLMDDRGGSGLGGVSSSDGVQAALGGASGGGHGGHGGHRSVPRVAMTSGEGTVAVDDEIAILSSALGSLFESSRYLDEEAMVHLVSALGALTLNALANAATVASVEREAARAAAVEAAEREAEQAALYASSRSRHQANNKGGAGHDKVFDDFELDDFDLSASTKQRKAQREAAKAKQAAQAAKASLRAGQGSGGVGGRSGGSAGGAGGASPALRSSMAAAADSVHARVLPPFALLKLVETARHNIFRHTHTRNAHLYCRPWLLPVPRR